MTAGTPYWMAAQDTVTEGVWVWKTSGKSVTYTHWGHGEPNEGRKQNCLLYYVDRMLHSGPFVAVRVGAGRVLASYASCTLLVLTRCQNRLVF